MSDPRLFQKIQDYFCKANGVYLSCLNKSEGVITKSYGDASAKDFVYRVVGEDKYMSLISKLENCVVENVIEEPIDTDYVKLYGVSVAIEGEPALMWVAVALIDEKLPDDVRYSMPEGIITTSEKRFYISLEFLEVLTKQILVTMKNESTANAALAKTKKTDEELKKQFHMLEAINSVIKLLEVDESFSDIAKSALSYTVEALGLSGAFIIRQNVDGIHLDVIVSCGNRKFDTIGIVEAPFFTGKPYIISANSLKPEKFRLFMEKYQMKAAIFQPVEVNSKMQMYICFFDDKKDRVWESYETKFLNDTKRVIQSVLTKKITTNSLAGSYASLEAILESSGCGIYVADPAKREILYMNNCCKELFCNTIEQNKMEDYIFSNAIDGKTYTEMYSVEEDKWFDVHRTGIKWVDGRHVRLATLYDITQKKRYQQKMENQANNDFLTGLYNRMRCEQDLEKFIAQSVEDGGKGALIYIDLDDFKHINDGLGHQYGDVLLKAISHSLTHIPGIENYCYRMGGDEFIVIVTGDTIEELERIIKDIQEIFVKPWYLKGEDYYCTISGGVAFFPTDAKTVEEVIRRADIALFNAKKEGKNRIEFYNRSSDGKSTKRLDLEKHMRKAAMNECEEFKVYFQPIMDVSGNDMCAGAEALVRWNSSTMGFINPVDFIPLAEYLGLINPIGEHVLREAAKHCKYWNDMGYPDYKVNVNLSVVQLLQNDIVKKIKNVIDDIKIEPKNLCLEVTESLAINDMVRMKRILNEIKSLGVKVALDDFGTGYSSLNHIREMPIDIIKIDKCFIEHIGQDDFSDAFVKMVKELANTIGVKVCVEGVETKTQYDIIKKMGIDYIQGYYFDKPMCIEDFESRYV